MSKNLYTGNLVWIDLEMTGLNPETDVILEIASLITDGNLNIIAQGPSYVIHQPESVLTSMNPWCITHHQKSGLTKAVITSSISLSKAYEETLLFIKAHCPKKTGILAGNSIGQDKIFLTKYMPEIIEYLHYRIIDVTTIKELIGRWYKNSQEYKKSDTHRALSDIHESIAELKYYQKNFFI